ncbi:VOC family protein [Haloarchaeobius sp. HRN-SO-5]|uniref:VOC family protein n=1 Tax=Haloarchaeobius sp. HRN-SO-5 TaxID=3446118 RepID=UPI003EBEFB25
MVTVDFNHVSVLAKDIDESAEFYCDVLGMERIPTPNFEVPVQWLQAGSGQLHLFEREMDAVPYYHFGVTVDDFEGIYRRAEEGDFFANWDDNAEGSVYRLPDDSAQMYLSDPAGNLLEVDYPDIDALPEDITAGVVDRSELHPQTGEAANGSLNISPVGDDATE